MRRADWPIWPAPAFAQCGATCALGFVWEPGDWSRFANFRITGRAEKTAMRHRHETEGCVRVERSRATGEEPPIETHILHQSAMRTFQQFPIIRKQAQFASFRLQGDQLSHERIKFPRGALHGFEVRARLTR